MLKRYPVQYAVIAFCIVTGLIPALLLVLLVTYALKQLQGPVAPLPWIDFIGEHAARWVIPLVRDTRFESGVPVDFQTAYFAAILALVGFAAAMLRFVQEYLLEDMGEKLSRDLRKEVFAKFLTLPYPVAQGTEAGLVASMVGEDAREIRQTFTRLMGSIVSDGLSCFVFAALLAILDTQLFLLFIAVLVPAGLVIRVTGKSLKRLSRQGLSSQTELLSSMLEKMRGWQTIQVNKAVDFETERFNQTNSTLFHVWRRSARAKALGSPLVEWLGILAASFIIVLALRRIAEDALSSSVLTGFLVTIAQLSNAGQSLTSQLNSARKGTESLRRIQEFLLLKPDFETGAESSIKNSFKTSIDSALKSSTPEASEHKMIGQRRTPVLTFDVRNLNLIHPTTGQVFVKNVNLQLRPGSLLAIVGPSGSGKSTLLRTLLGLTDQHFKSIFINGHTLLEHDFLPFARDTVFIPQDPFVFEGSIFENVVYPDLIDSHQSAARKNVAWALARANLEKNLNSLVTGLSGGEKQRLMFARAFYRRASLWIIDEGTSALDMANERELLTRMKEDSADKIILFVAHRPLIREFCTDVLDLSHLEHLGPQETT